MQGNIISLSVNYNLIMICFLLLVLRFPKDRTTYRIDWQFLLGPAILITPVLLQVGDSRWSFCHQFLSRLDSSLLKPIDKIFFPDVAVPFWVQLETFRFTFTADRKLWCEVWRYRLWQFLHFVVVSNYDLAIDWRKWKQKNHGNIFHMAGAEFHRC